jgi:hypothetical protein
MSVHSNEQFPIRRQPDTPVVVATPSDSPPSLSLPHERDESAPAARAEAEPAMLQANRDTSTARPEAAPMEALSPLQQLSAADSLDATKLIPEELVPATPVGRMVLNRNPDNFFAETEQVAFCTAHVVPGIDFSNDPLLAGRIHSRLDIQITRLGKLTGPAIRERMVPSLVNVSAELAANVAAGWASGFPKRCRKCWRYPRSPRSPHRLRCC